MKYRFVYAAFWLLIGVAPLPAHAEMQEYIRDYSYHGAFFDSATSCRVNAIEGVKRELLEELGTYVGSVVKMHQDSLGNSYMSQDVVNITAGIVAMKVLDEKWKRPVYYVKAGIKADPDDVLSKLHALRADLELEKSLRESHEDLQSARELIARLRSQLEQIQQKGQLPTEHGPVATVVPAAVLPETVAPASSKPEATTPVPVLVDAAPPASVPHMTPSEDVTPTEHDPVATVMPAAVLPETVAPASPKPEATTPVPVLVDAATPVSAPLMTPTEEVTPAPAVERLVEQYQKASRDIEAGEAFRRALVARISGDFAGAMREIGKLADEGNAKAQFRMGWFYERGLGVDQDYAKARAWYEKAMANGEPDAIARMGMLYEFGLGVEKDHGRAAEYYRRAIDAGSILGLAHLGYLYETGKGVPFDRVQAAALYRQGVEKGNYLAMARLGFLYQLGRGVEQDDAQAVRLYREAVDHGQPLAMTRLGQMYNLGRGGLPRDHAKALALIQESVHYKLPAGYAFMGFMYENGWEVARDYTAARQLYEKAAALDAPFAELRLGIMYKDGLGVGANRDKAMYWLERAAGKGEDKAVLLLQRMRRHPFGG